MNAPHVLQPGVHVGPYELTQFLGEGGFAEVWRASHPTRAGSVAVKVLRRHRARDVKMRTMLLDEALIASKIHHPNVAEVYELAEDRGLIYFAMEYVGGSSLDALADAARASGARIPAAVGVRILMDACAGIHAAHELTIDGRPMGLVHRDVSPQNILIGEDGVGKIIDFGVAKALERLTPETTTGIAKGKVSYMSPEHARGEELDRRADVWSLAAVAYEVFEGHTVVSGPNPVARLQPLLSGSLELSFCDTPPELVDPLRRALSMSPAQRQATAAELGRDVESAFVAARGAVASAADVAAYVAHVLAAAERVSPRDTQSHPAGVRVARAGLSPGVAARALETTASDVGVVATDATARAPSAGSPRRAWLLAGGVVAAVAIGAGGRALVLRSPSALPPSPPSAAIAVPEPSASAPLAAATPASEARPMSTSLVTSPSAVPPRPAAAPIASTAASVPAKPRVPSAPSRNASRSSKHGVIDDQIE